MPTEGLPFMDGGPMGGIAAMAATPYMGKMMGHVGMTPMGVGHDQNVYDRLMNQRYSMMQMQAMQSAAASDRDNYMKTFRGLAAISGTPFGAEQRRAAMSLANSATMMAPMFAEMMPDFMDQMGGLRGSATVMSKRIIDAGRYRMDPVTGRMGMSAETAGAVSNNLYGSLYSDEHLPKMKGVTAGQVGSLYGELQMRGMVGTAAAEGRYMGIRGDDPRAATFKAIEEMRSSNPDLLAKAAQNQKVDLGKPGGITASDLDKLNLDPNVAGKLRSFDSDRIKRSVKSYVDVVAAMRDIFGDMGKPNAPMQELIAGIEALTMGGMGQIDPGRMGMMVRQTYNLAKQTGVSLDNVMQMQGHAAQRAGQMGIEPTFAMQATQGALAFGGAYRAQGHAAHQAWGTMNADQVTQLDSNLRVQASSSNMANRMAAAVRMAEQVGGFDDDSEAGRFVAAAKGGSNEYRAADGSIKSMMLNDRDFARMMTTAKDKDGKSANVSEGDVQSMLSQRDTNREYVEKYAMGNTVRRSQGTDELHPFIGGRMQETLAAKFRESLGRQGVPAAEAAKRAHDVAATIGQKVTRKMFDLSTEEFADTGTRNKAIAGFIQDELESNVMGDVLGDMKQGDKDKFLAQTADRFYGSANRAIKGSMYRSFGNIQNVHRLTNKTTLDESDRQSMKARFTSEMQDAMSPLGHGSMLQRAVDALQHARPDSDGLEVVAAALGGVKIEDINRTMMPQFRKLTDKRKEVEELQKQIQATSDPLERGDMMTRLEVVRRELNAQAGHLAKTGEQFGLFSADTLTTADVSRAQTTTKGVMNTQNDIVGIRGNFGWDVSADNIKNMKEGLAKPDNKSVMFWELDDTDRVAILAGRKQKDVDMMRDVVSGKPGATPLSKGQQDDFEAMKGLVRKQNGFSLLDEQSLNRATVDAMASNVMNMDPTKLKDIKAETDDDYRMLIRTRRRQIPYRAEKEAVDAIRKQYPQITEEEAGEIANTRMRSARLGLDQADVKKHMKAHPDSYKGPYGEVEAIADLFANRSEAQFDVSDDDIKKLTEERGYKVPDRGLIDRFKGENKSLIGKDDPVVVKEMQRRMVMAGRQKANRTRWDEYWGSMEGAANKEGVDMAMQDVENVASKLVQSPQMVQRLGSRAIEVSETLKTDQQRLRELALYHSGGDVAKLLNRDFSNVDMKREGAKDMVSKLNVEITDIQARQRNFLAELSSSDGIPGRRFQMGEDQASRRKLVDIEVAANRMSKEDADKIVNTAVSPAMGLKIEAMRRDLGSDERARGILEIDPKATNLNEIQRAAIAGVRYGAGSEDEAKLVYGLEKWDKLGPAERNDALVKMRGGLKTDDAAAQFLGISPEMLANDRDGDLAKRIAAVKVGLQTDDHAKQILKPFVKRDEQWDAKSKSFIIETDEGFKKRETEYANHVRSVRMGLYNPELAKEKLGVPKDMLDDPKYHGLRTAVEKDRELWGNEQEALRLMGKKPTDKLNQKELGKLKQLSYDVGVTRRISAEDTGALGKLEQAQKMVDTVAEVHGLSTKDLDEKGDSLVLTGDQMGRMLAGKKDYDVADHGLRSSKVRAASLRTQIANLERSSGETDNPAKQDAILKHIATAKANLAKVEGEVTKFEADKGKVEERVGEDAILRGKTSADYLKGKGFITADSLKFYRGYVAERDAAQKKVKEIALGLGFEDKDLEGVTRVNKMLLGKQAESARKENANPVDLTRSILTEFGFKTGTEADPFEKSFARLVEGTAGRGFAQRILETQTELKTVAGRGAGLGVDKDGKQIKGSIKDIDKMAGEYFKAVQSGKAEDVTAFRKAHGLHATDSHGNVTGDSNQKFDKFAKAMQFQQQTGLLSLDGSTPGVDGGTGHRTKTKRMDLLNMYEKALQGGDQRPGVPMPAGHGQGMPGKMEMTGSVTLKGDQLDFAGAFGGGRAYGTGGP